MKDLNNKVALLTGASSGIGAVIANLLAQENVTVVGVARSKSGLNNTKGIIENLGGEFHGIAFDISQTSKLSELKVQVANAIGEVDILINNAGIEEYNYFQDYDLEYIEKLAREKYRMAKPGEKVFKVIPKESNKNSNQ